MSNATRKGEALDMMTHYFKHRGCLIGIGTHAGDELGEETVRIEIGDDPDAIEPLHFPTVMSQEIADAIRHAALNVESIQHLKKREGQQA